MPRSFSVSAKKRMNSFVLLSTFRNFALDKNHITMISRLRHVVVWLSRISHCRGFGIQSPTDYGFVRYVINEHWPYYAYERWSSDDWLTRKLGKLYFRLANWRQPHIIESNHAEDYLHAGCRNAVIESNAEHADLIIANPDDIADINTLLDKADEKTVLVAEGIWQHPDWWERLLSDERVRTAFDLYYCGIACFDSSRRFRQTYIVNF
jgi:hypothetical protein